MDSRKKIEEIEYKITILSQSVKQFETEITLLRQEVATLRALYTIKPERLTDEQQINQSIVAEPEQTGVLGAQAENELYFDNNLTPPQPATHTRKNLEEFIGGNVVNKIGILILVLGVGIFLNYAIESNLIGPLGRIMLGYITGTALVGIAYRLKKQYTAYSAVLLSGGVATLYFATYVAYDFYAFIPQWATFLLMVAITIFTVYAAIAFDQQVIGVLGLAGAYAVPILLSNGSGKVEVLFAYMAIINTGVAVLASRKKWLQMNTTAFVLTWLIFTGWFLLNYETQHVFIATLFSCLFFLIFHTVFLFYQLALPGLHKNNTLWIILNSFIFYGTGYAVFDDYETGKWLSIFTLANAFIHAMAAGYVYSVTRSFSTLLYLLTGLIITFITLAIPIGLGGSWTTLLWSVEAAILFWIGRKRQLLFIEQVAYVLLFLSICSLLNDWSFYTNVYTPVPVTFLLNIHFATSCWVVVTLLTILWTSKYYSYEHESNTFLKYVLPSLTISIAYFAFFQEISFYYESQAVIESNAAHTLLASRMLLLKWVWLMNYSAIFITLLAFIAIRYIPVPEWHKAVWLFNALLLILWCIYGLPKVNALRDQYFFADSQSIPAYTIWIRYINYFFIGLSVLATQQLVNRGILPKKSPFIRYYPIVLHIFVLVLLSAELIQFTLYFSSVPQAASNQVIAQKLGFSVLWGAYSFFLIAIGIWRKKKILRLMGISLFAVTLLKLFVLDLNNISTLSKIIAFIGLGILLLVISFLYQKFKSIILAEDAS